MRRWFPEGGSSMAHRQMIDVWLRSGGLGCAAATGLLAAGHPVNGSLYVSAVGTAAVAAAWRAVRVARRLGAE